MSDPAGPSTIGSTLSGGRLSPAGTSRHRTDVVSTASGLLEGMANSPNPASDERPGSDRNCWTTATRQRRSERLSADHRTRPGRQARVIHRLGEATDGDEATLAESFGQHGARHERQVRTANAHVVGVDCGGSRRVCGGTRANGIANGSAENPSALATTAQHQADRQVASALLRPHESPSDITDRTALLTLSRWRHGFESRTGCQESPGQSHSPEWLSCFPAPVANGVPSGSCVASVRGGRMGPAGFVETAARRMCSAG